MSSLPEDVWRNIFLRLPVKSAKACKYVCKSWFSIISDPGFIKTHLQIPPHRGISHYLLVGGDDCGNEDALYSISYDPLEPSPWNKEFNLSRMCYPYKSLGYGVELLDSCDGLVCLWYFPRYNHVGSVHREELFFCLWNPATQEYRKINKPASIFAYFKIWMCAFGYDHKSDDYKLVIGVNNFIQGSSIHVYTLRPGSWKSVVTVNYSFFSSRKSGLFVNGRFHWLTDAGQRKLIVSLDINQERFGEMQLPIKLEANERSRFITGGLLDGCLCVLVRGDGNHNCAIWVMQDYGVPESWAKFYTIEHKIIMRAISDSNRYCTSLMFIYSLKNGEILFMTPNKLVLYDPKKISAIERHMGCGGFFRHEVNYSESLVSVYSGNKKRRNSGIN